MACTLGNKCDKNCCKRTFLVQLITEDVVTFFETQFIFYVHAVQVQSYRSSNRTLETRPEACSIQTIVIKIMSQENGGHLKDGLLLGGAIRYVRLFCLLRQSYRAM